MVGSFESAFREIRRNPSVTFFGPFGFWCFIHTAITSWLFLNEDCSLHANLVKGRLLLPVGTVAFVLVTFFFYLWALGTAPKVSDPANTSAVVEAAGEEEEENPNESAGLLSKAQVVVEGDIEAGAGGEGGADVIEQQEQEQQQSGDDLLLPLRSKYCKKCKACVLRHDHHCPFFGGELLLLLLLLVVK